jgi:hypothetical protein
MAGIFPAQARARRRHRDEHRSRCCGCDLERGWFEAETDSKLRIGAGEPQPYSAGAPGRGDAALSVSALGAVAGTRICGMTLVSTFCSDIGPGSPVGPTPDFSPLSRSS